mgnify:CR=1 FL=1|jgi:hypothetical protein
MPPFLLSAPRIVLDFHLYTIHIDEWKTKRFQCLFKNIPMSVSMPFTHFIRQRGCYDKNCCGFNQFKRDQIDHPEPIPPPIVIGK